MRTKLVALALAFSLSQGCILTTLLTRPPAQVQIVAAAADAVDAANSLGEVVLDLSASAHKLHQSKVIPVETDNAVQNAAILFANTKDKAVSSMAAATNAAQVLAAAAPLVGAATSVTTAMKNVNTNGLTGAASIAASQVPQLLTQAQALIKRLGGK